MSPEALRGRRTACPPYTPFLSPNLVDAPWAAQDPVRKRAAKAGRRRRRRSSAKTSILKTSQLGLHYSRHIVAGESAGAWGNLGGLGAMLTNLAHPLELPAT